MIREAIEKVVQRISLSREEARAAMGEIMDGQATPAQIASLITALRMKGETVEEIVGFAQAMRERSVRISPRVDHLLDTCGTGGDRLNTFNISTIAAFVIAGSGVHVAKHGNRSVSSRCGSADLLEALQIPLDADPASVERCIEEERIGFLFAPRFHLAMKHALGPRREIGIRTVFNILGPLTNPAGAQYQILGVADPSLVEVMAECLLELGARRVMVVHGLDGMDELSICAPTKVAEVDQGTIRTYTLDPGEIGLSHSDLTAISGGTPEENARIALSILQGEHGPRRDAVVLNAAAGLYISGHASDLREGVVLACESIDSGAAYDRLVALRGRLASI
ncbi:MAG: anthranilate phosphoribosyltransferase [Armatimonadota bacterium]|nr:anthranilate phosphoribosyltransferase [Armatimonadota bacterium]